MPTALQFLESKPKKTRVFAIYGEDEALRVDVVRRIRESVAPDDTITVWAGFSEGCASPAQVWDAVMTRPLAGVSSRLVIVYDAEKLRAWAPLQAFIKGASVMPETVLVLAFARPEMGKRQRSRRVSLPGQAVWETVLAEHEQWLKDYGSAAVVTARPLSIDPGDRGKPSPVARWLSLRVPLTQRQAEFLWRRVGADSALARDACAALRALGVADATGLSGSEFQTLVSAVVGVHGAEDLVDALLFERWSEAFASVTDQEFSAAEWSKILGLLAQRLDWLSQLHIALGTNELLDQVMRRLNIHRKWILYYAHREDARHNVARRFDHARVTRARRVIADFDSWLNRSRGVPPGFGEVLISAW